MADTLIDLKAILVEHEDCDAGTVQKLRTGLAQGGTQLRALREAADALQKKIEIGAGNKPKLHLKLGIAFYFLGYMDRAADNLALADTALAGFYQGRALVARGKFDEALKAFDKAEKAGYTCCIIDTPPAMITIIEPCIRIAEGGLVVLGETNNYEPLCRDCFNEAKN